MVGRKLGKQLIIIGASAWIWHIALTSVIASEMKKKKKKETAHFSRK